MKNKNLEKETLNLDIYKIDLEECVDRDMSDERFVVQDIIGLAQYDNILSHDPIYKLTVGIVSGHFLDKVDRDTAKRYINNILSIIDRDGKDCGILVVNYSTNFMDILPEFKDILPTEENKKIYESYKLSDEQQAEYDRIVKDYDTFYESLDFHSIDGYCNFENNTAYVYGYIGEKYSIISDMLRKIKTLPKHCRINNFHY